ncbi:MULTISPECIES: hypothetical protein [unclassified Cryobacterium]|uniref:hypothetical protein n=1 Tax=unclassified Cryobacterium TaxID=2649013 RepID=UPI00106CD924|nr:MULTISPECIES: hypothetical protein [unclassified Cryobacterium]TFB97671.1 hypothetical protein E3O39_07615 [Cryobacterium sp. MDB2-A-1]TFC07791.1 hypothetical protein E3O35_18245 [Cryobacterium sp. MDB2-A-2]TFC21023.1 hypothetical protein E3O51_04775 [Cryobacterium sp. MDB2-10]
MNKRGEDVVSQLTAAVVVLAVLPAVFVAGQASSDMRNAILGSDGPVIAQAALTYWVVTAVLGGCLTVLGQMRFHQSRRRISAAWGASLAIIVLFIFMGLLVFLTLALLPVQGAYSSTARQDRARIAGSWLPVLTLLTYIAALSYGLFARAKTVTRGNGRLQLAIVAIVIALPGCTAAGWFVAQR